MLSDSPDHPAPFDRDSDVYRRLVITIANGAVLLVGAGSSCRVGYPGWVQLLAHLAEAAKRKNPAKTADIEMMQGTDGLLQASVYRRILGDPDYFSEICTLYGPRTPQHDAFHEKLVKLPFKHVLTTNYEGVLQSAHAKVFSRPADSFDVDEWEKLSWFRQKHATVGRYYVHLHGSTRRHQGIILCQEDYDARYVNENRPSEFLRNLLTGHRVVFVGFSYADEDFNHILRLVAGSLNLSEPRHFALLPSPGPADEVAKRINFERKYGVEPLFFNNACGDYSSLVTLIGALLEDVQRAKQANQANHSQDLVDQLSNLLQDLIPDQPDLRETLNQRLPDMLESYIVPLTLSDTDMGGHSDTDGEIVRIFKLIDKGLPDEAINEYEALRAKHDSVLTLKQRYRIEANIGSALYSQGKMDAAADAYFRAVGFYRESRDALALEILAWILRGEMAQALRLAEALCQQEPGFGRARSLWIQAQPDSANFSQVEAAVPEDLLRDAEVAFALSHLARRMGDELAHERYARLAVELLPNWPDALFELGCAILAYERGHAKPEAEHGLIAQDLARVAEAESLFTKAIERVPATDPMNRLAWMYFNRSTARRIGGSEQEANSDLKEAFRRTPGEPAIILAYAMQAETAPEIAEALSALGAFAPDTAERDQLQYMQALLLLRRRQPGELNQAFAIVQELSRRLGIVMPPVIRSDIVRLGLHILAEQGQSATGPSFVSDLPTNALPAHMLEMCHGRAELFSGNRERAAEHVREAIRMLGDDASWFERREAALLAQDCGLHAEALALWELILDVESTGVDTIHMVRCAYFAEQWKKVLEVCARVRASGRYRREHLEAEVDVLAQSFEVDRALLLQQEWLGQHPDDKKVRLHLSLLALQHGRRELATFDESQLPSVAELARPEDGATLVHVLRHGPTSGRALDIAYQLYRRFPDHIATHRTLVMCIFSPLLPQLEIERPVAVGRNTAASIRRDGESPRWIYIEDGPAPAVTRREYAESHELVVALWGRKAGERFDFQGHGYEVVSVENRVLHRVHEIMERYEENFPDQPLLRRFNIPINPPDDAPPEAKLGEMMTELKRQAERNELLQAMYRESRLPIASLATLLGRSTFDVVCHLANDPTMGIQADSGLAKRWPEAITNLRKTTEIVLDSTVLAGALILNLWDILPRLGFRFVVPRAVLDEIRELSLNTANSRTPQGTLGLYQGKLFFQEISLEEMARRVEALERVIKFINESCEVVGGAATLDLQAEDRKKMQQVLGVAATDALALAKKRNGVLWTDDLGLQALVSQPDLNVRSVWTQAVLSASRDAGRISTIEYTTIIGRQIERGYTFMRLSARDIANLLRNVGWRLETPMGAGLVRIIKDMVLMNAHNRLITAHAFIYVWLECPKRFLARKLITSILDDIGRDKSGQLAALIYRGYFARESLTPKIRSLKRMLRSWRSRDGEFRPKR